MTDLLTQLRDYGRQIEADPMLHAAMPLDGDVLVLSSQTRRRSRPWARALIAAGTVLLVFLPVMLARFTEEPVATTEITNGWVAFAAYDELAEDVDIFMVRPGVELRRLIGSPGDGLDQYCTSFSPDGSKLVYMESGRTGLAPGERGGFGPHEVVVAGLDEAGISGELLRAPANWRVCPTWSPDSTRVAYVTDSWDLTVGTVEGSVASLSRLESSHTGIRWSPDGRVIAVWAFSDDSTPSTAIRLVPVDGSETKVLATLSGYMPELVGAGGYMDWSPDSSRLAVLVEFGDGIHVIDLDGTIHLIEGVFSSSIAWSPQGDLLAVTEENGVTLVRSDNFEGQRLVIDYPGETVTDATFQSWSSDGQSILVRVSGLNTSAILSVPLDQEASAMVIHQWPGRSLETEGISWQRIAD